jgi:hypothetical protein
MYEYSYVLSFSLGDFIVRLARVSFRPRPTPAKSTACTISSNCPCQAILSACFFTGQHDRCKRKLMPMPTMLMLMLTPMPLLPMPPMPTPPIPTPMLMLMLMPRTQSDHTDVIGARLDPSPPSFPPRDGSQDSTTDLQRYSPRPASRQCGQVANDFPIAFAVAGAITHPRPVRAHSRCPRRITLRSVVLV